jgi:hypothetical protein
MLNYKNREIKKGLTTAAFSFEMLRGCNLNDHPISKITRAKWTGNVVQTVEHLLCKHEALSPNPSTPPKKKTKKLQTLYSPQMSTETEN